ncbi:hypothetical protein BZG36_03410 [Bifiguratus adelaidae]|uniref:Xylanolytic transcriptional activator regulatory domain-containing protein n=1 Tax=Bifiguratus adelaidae TaxID=1938954 RepID=A0A261XZ44_9FUNG|nr:hypothetical protein BZG36_03410 [Bifiguratus adelaidae]
MRPNILSRQCFLRVVKCDFIHPRCSRCTTAHSECQYAGGPSQVDLFTFVHLNDAVNALRDRLESVETSLSQQEGIRGKGDSSNPVSRNPNQSDNVQVTHKDIADDTVPRTVCRRTLQSNSELFNTFPEARKDWSLSLTPRGIRIDTDIISIDGLYNILLSGTSVVHVQRQVKSTDGSSEISSKTSTPPIGDGMTSTDSTPILSEYIEDNALGQSIILPRNYPLWRPHHITFPIYNVWDPVDESKPQPAKREDDKQKSGSFGLYGSKTAPSLDVLSRPMQDGMISMYLDCFIAYSTPSKDDFREAYASGALDPLVLNAVLAWTVRHAAVHHNMFHEVDPIRLGDHFFAQANALLKERFLTSNFDTALALMMMYMYQFGRPTTPENKEATISQAYLYLGMCNRMILDLKLHMCQTTLTPVQQQSNKRLFWAAYFLESIISLHTERPPLIINRDRVEIDHITPLEQEDDETRYKVEFMRHRQIVAEISLSILKHAESKEPLLGNLSMLAQRLRNWLASLPSYFHYSPKDKLSKSYFQSTSFREQACLKLNLEYQFQLLQLHRPFITPPDGSPSTVGLLSKRSCRTASLAMVELLECYLELQQTWCHFTLEAIAAGSEYLQFEIGHPQTREALSNEECETITDALRRIMQCMKRSPIRSSRAVTEIISSIKATLNSAHRGSKRKSLASTDDLNSARTYSTAQSPHTIDSRQQNHPLTRSDIAVSQTSSESSTFHHYAHIPLPVTTHESHPISTPFQDPNITEEPDNSESYPSPNKLSPFIQYTDFMYTTHLMDGSNDLMRHFPSELPMQQVSMPNSLTDPNGVFYPPWSSMYLGYPND